MTIETMATGFRRSLRHAPGGVATGLLIEFDAAIQHRVGDIHKEIEHHENGAIDNDNAFEQKDIVVQDRVDEERPGTRDIEDRFDD
jgi:hypothetical protein